MFLDSANKKECFGCEACVQVCEKKAISMYEDIEGFRYPSIDKKECIECGLCRKICPYENTPNKQKYTKYVFGGYHTDSKTRFDSTSGGAFSAIANAFCDVNYVIFGAESKGVSVFHSYITDKKELYKFRKSKYVQSQIGTTYKKVKIFLKEGKKVLFSGTPCQIAALMNYLGGTNTEKLLTVEVICEGVPSPLYVSKLEQYIIKKYEASIDTIDYRYTGKSIMHNGKWDFQIMKISLKNKKRILEKDRWVNPFWSIWLSHLMSRPVCYNCKFTSSDRVSDITLGDLWGIHLFCPELYGDNSGTSLVICNTEKGKNVFLKSQQEMFGHELKLDDIIKYQSPLRKTINENPDRALFMTDLESSMEFNLLNKKWAPKPSLNLLFHKYIWGNRQKIFLWKIKQNIFGKKGY